MGDKIEREIQEILNRLDEFVPDDDDSGKIRRFRRPRRAPDWLRRLRSFLTSIFRQVSRGHVMIAALALVLAGLVLGDALGSAARWLTVSGLALFVLAFVLAMRAGPRVYREKKWRGEVIDIREPSAWDRLHAWFDRKRRGRHR